MPYKIIAQGAEASILTAGSKIIKERVAKSYRTPELDSRLRRMRTRKELKLLEKSSQVIQVPKIIASTEYNIVMEKIPGKKLASTLDKTNKKMVVAKQIGQAVAKLHDQGIIHGDLTTSNMIWHDKKIWLIDFGLGFESNTVEDKAVDVHVFKEALEARHHKFAVNLFKAFISGYKSSKNAGQVIKHLETVEKRGRYKAQF